MTRPLHPSDRFLIEAEVRRISAHADHLERMGQQRQADASKRWAWVLRGYAK